MKSALKSASRVRVGVLTAPDHNFALLVTLQLSAISSTANVYV